MIRIVDMIAWHIFCNKNLRYGILNDDKNTYACACMDRPPNDIRNVRIAPSSGSEI